MVDESIGSHGLIRARGSIYTTSAVREVLEAAKSSSVRGGASLEPTDPSLLVIAKSKGTSSNRRGVRVRDAGGTNRRRIDTRKV